MMDEKAREEKRRYEREWRSKNRDKVAAIQARYWEKKARERGTKREEATD